MRFGDRYIWGKAGCRSFQENVRYYLCCRGVWRTCNYVRHLRRLNRLCWGREQAGCLAHHPLALFVVTAKSTHPKASAKEGPAQGRMRRQGLTNAPGTTQRRKQVVRDTRGKVAAPERKTNGKDSENVSEGVTRTTTMGLRELVGVRTKEKGGCVHARRCDVTHATQDPHWTVRVGARLARPPANGVGAET